MSASPLETAFADPKPGPSPTDRAGAGTLLATLFALVGLPVAAHFAFSRFGFNPTDDGFILAYSRRLLDGQVPHRDFISIRPVGSALLHAPWVLFGGNHTYLLARLAVWFEFALIAWCWVRLGTLFTRRPHRPVHEATLTTVAFMLGASTFPVMPWHTLDALALGSVGVLLASSSRSTSKVLGYVLMGAAVLCRQNFLPLGPLAALLLGDRRRPWVGFWFLLPPAAYAGYLLAAGALEPAVAQLSAQAGIQETAFGVFFKHPWTLVGVLVGQCAVLARGDADAERSRRRWAAEAIAWAVALSAAGMLPLGGAVFIDAASFGLFGVSLGIALGMTLALPRNVVAPRFAALALLVAWCASISIGLNTPSLATGLLAVVPLLLLTPRDRPIFTAVRRPPMAAAARVVLAAVICVLWVYSRLHVIYRDRPAIELTRALDGVLPGGSGLHTNPDTGALMADLRSAVAITHGRPHAIVADFPGYWVKAAERNPLSIDWAQSVELSSPVLRQRVENELMALRGHGCVIVQKFAAAGVARESRPAAAGAYYFVPDFVRSHFKRFGETADFDLYR